MHFSDLLTTSWWWKAVGFFGNTQSRHRYVFSELHIRFAQTLLSLTAACCSGSIPPQFDVNSLNPNLLVLHSARAFQSVIRNAVSSSAIHVVSRAEFDRGTVIGACAGFISTDTAAQVDERKTSNGSWRP
jgi:hypothetical protein